ncbi:winged helix-turn-helix domain-containing protein [Anaerovorax odorimutans]|uniref:Winged helix-turn-helix domain-containing protein n=1 Tax=Anaerovorax odorimutans TaxID=109327 RepID=A0ABT1RSM5_9FIRM|nr:winged helix-turn-helix domain-containing protein [Anaerovorax odorimutans]MCQ4638208.1 winged helix-turn-helix domain-containing protein [Anaerovorax odorimutans]
MEENNGLNELIYEYYESRILFGIYRYGEQLKSVPQICASFGLARNTVQTALRKLEKNGYIKTEKRKVARVVYQGTEDLFRENAAKYFAPRKEGFLDFRHAGNLMFLPIWEKGLRNIKMNRQNAVCGKGDAVPSEPSKLYMDVLNSFDNDLMRGLYWQCLRYLSYFYPKRNDRKANYVTEDLLSEEKANRLKQETDVYYERVLWEVLDFAESMYGKQGLEKVDQIPFTWIIYRRRPQVRYTLASAIIRQILWERYPPGSYLPSLPKMAEQYQVSLSTVRRTLEVLQALGVTQTHMGVGTEVCLKPIDPDIINKSEIQENLRLHGEAMQLLALTVRNVTLYTLESAAKDKRENLLQEISKLHGKNNNILCIDVLLKFISRQCPSAFIRECYGKLSELAAWGYIFFAVLRGTGRQPDMDLTDFISQLERDLQTDHLTAFAEKWQSFIEDRTNFFYSNFSL